MAEFPALPIFTDAYLADTRHLTTEEHGAYLLLLMCAWRTRGCALRDDDRFLARTAGVSPYKWRRLKPVLSDFFEVEGGLWRQKKLSGVYRNVEERVARNRVNGAKGGRARAAKDQHLKQANAMPDAVATKTKNQNPKAEAAGDIARGYQAPGGTIQSVTESVLEAAALERAGVDASPVAEWLEAGALPELDIIPVVLRLRRRQQEKTGKAPASMAYYSRAIFEARDKRVGAIAAGRERARKHPPQPEKKRFDLSSTADWQAFLGDADNRFRGDYLSANWGISTGHPVFLPMGLGPDPRARFNPLIPAKIRARYGPFWRWVMAPVSPAQSL